MSIAEEVMFMKENKQEKEKNELKKMMDEIIE